MLLFPRRQLLEIGDQPWCPPWIIAYIQSCLTSVWNLHIPPFSKTSPAGVAANVILENLPAQGYPRARLVLTDLHPNLSQWKAIAKRQENVDYVAGPLDATKCGRVASPEDKECRMLNLCFHHFDDKAAASVLRSAVESADSFIIIEFAQRNFTSLLNILAVTVLPFIHTIFQYWNSPLHLFFTYFVPLHSFVMGFDGLVSTIRCRTPEEIDTLLRQPGLDLHGWEFRSGNRMMIMPFLHMYWYMGIKRSDR
ncbi:hypothetical protein EYZ11_006360 [Aspergillus tanneri]|uniref:Methyltransferase domain-containing protein n=1 Tax=Aspergillus tanneri TaxID=1220188 RepID=A0A4S3JFZ3_9EURO|nr:hypothetical protein EYZ11_006360 [Aspergillus tanneri]